MLPRDVSSFDHDPPKDVIEVLPAVRRFYTRGEITLGDYNRNWPIILCCEISKKIGLNLVYKQTVTLTTTGPTPVVTVWFMGISYRYICGYQQINPTLSEEENVREAIGALYNRLSDVGAVPSGIARLCARFELLKPVVLLTLPWFQHLMIKINETLYKDLMFDMPTRPMNETALLVKVESLTKYLQKWSAHYWTNKLCMRCPSYVQIVRLWGAGVPNVRLPNEKFKEIYDCSGVRSGVIQFLEDYLVEDSDPQKQRKALQKRIDFPPDGSPHPLLLGVPEALTSYLDGLDSRCPIPLAINEFIDFFNGGADKSKSMDTPMPSLLLQTSRTTNASLESFVQQKDDTLFVPIDKPSDFQVIVQEKPGLNLLIQNLPEREKDPKVTRQVEIATVSEVLALVGVKDEDFDVLGRVRLPAYTSLYKPLPLQVRLSIHVRKPNLEDLNNALKRHPRLKTLAVSWFTEENEKQRKITEKGSRSRPETTRTKDRKRSHSRSRERKRSRDRERKREKSRSPRRSDKKSEPSIRDSSQPSLFGRDLREVYSRRVKNFVTKVAETADCKLVIGAFPEDPISTKVNAKFTDIPFMIQAEDIALASLIARLVDLGMVPNQLVDLVSTYDEWCAPICKVLGPCMNFAKAVLKSPDYAPILMEIANYEQNGQLFMPPTRVDQIYAVTKFVQTMKEFGAKHWTMTTLIAPDAASQIPQIADGSFKVVASDSREARDERTKEKKIKEKQEQRAKQEAKEAKKSKSYKNNKKEERSRSPGRVKARGKSPEAPKSETQVPMDIEKEALFVDLVSDDEEESSDKDDPEETIKRLAREEAELERKNQEIQRQLELLDKGLLKTEDAWALLSSLNKDVEKEKSSKKLEREMVEKKTSRKSPRSGSPWDERKRSVKTNDNKASDHGKQSKERISPLASHSNDKYAKNRSEISIKAAQKSRSELPEESRVKMPTTTAVVTTTTAVYSNPITTSAASFNQPIIPINSFNVQSSPNNIQPSTATIMTFPPSNISQPPPALPKMPVTTYVPPVNLNAQPQLQAPTVESNEELRKQAELLEEQLRLLQRLKALTKQIDDGGFSAPMVVAPTPTPDMRGPPPMQRITPAANWPNQSYVSPESRLKPPIIAQPVDPLGARRFQIFPPQLPSFVPDWCIDFLNEAEKITPFYLQKICSAVQDQGEIRQLLLEPRFCREHDPAIRPCAFHCHVGLNHKTVDCIVQLPWSRRIRLAELNGICLDKKICIMPHRGECPLRSQQCQFCGDLHFLAWCRKQAQMRNLYDVADEQQVISQNPVASMGTGSLPNTTFSYGM
ncbi:unnamed protein product, partial [Mesorhabditis belari]|uniref:Uncharacterized protein n=1 Tax=Mesorhabditis belari TaxID=2138241 RepID=A0AAF3EG83_9BILA